MNILFLAGIVMLALLLNGCAPLVAVSTVGTTIAFKPAAWNSHYPSTGS